MRYSIYFFALDSSDFTSRLATPEVLLRDVAARLREETEPDDQYAAEILRSAKRICSGDLPDDCNAEYFDALCWLAETAGEKIEIPEFVLFRGLSYLDEIGIWPLFQRDKPPFPLPVCSDPPPEAGFLDLSSGAGDVLGELEALPACESQEAEQARLQLHDVLESVLEDRLDMLAVLLQN